MSNQKFQYILSVRLMTYMHEAYIKEAMDSIMMQKTNFIFEIVIGDDFSTDRTLDIIKKYKSKDNIHIKILKREKGDAYWEKRKKYGRLYNFVDLINNCIGKYIALLDGDDYWTDPYKLQKQVDFLEANPDYGMVHTDFTLINNAGDKVKDHELIVKMRKFHKNKPDLDLYDLLDWNKIGTLTTCFRKHLIIDLFNEIKKYNMDVFYDYTIWLYISLQSKIHWLQDKTGAYRIGDNTFNQKGNKYNKHKWISNAKIRSEFFILNKLFEQSPKIRLSKNERIVISNTLWRIYRNKSLFTKKEWNSLKNIVPNYYHFILFKYIEKFTNFLKKIEK